MTGVTRSANRSSRPRDPVSGARAATTSGATSRTRSASASGAASTNGSALFEGYFRPDRAHPDAFDEMFAGDGTVRAPYRALHDAIAPTAAADLTRRSE